MERKQTRNWEEAQKIMISEDLVTTAKQQMKLLAAVDRTQNLYDGPALDKAIYRYKYCWLPLLAKHADGQFADSPLIVPLDCEWIWHCHRLNPMQYKADCEELHGSIVDNKNIVSSLKGASTKHTEAIWSRLYPNEAYEVDFDCIVQENRSENVRKLTEGAKYDLVSAVKRQSTFFSQVSRPCMDDDRYLKGAVERYKGFLQLIKKNTERALGRFCVPTYDIDLIWHSHQLHPASYSRDTIALLGHVLQHDDTDSDRTKDGKLSIGFAQTIRQWEEAFGSRYWRAGAMYRGDAGSPRGTTLVPLQIDEPSSEIDSVVKPHKTMVMEVMVEIVDVKNRPDDLEGQLFIALSKKQPDDLFNTKIKLTVESISGEKQVGTLESRPHGDFLFELVSLSHPPAKVLGSVLISVEDIMKSNPTTLSLEKWYELQPNSDVLAPAPMSLRIAISYTPPVQAQRQWGSSNDCNRHRASLCVTLSSPCGTVCLTQSNGYSNCVDGQIIKRGVVGTCDAGCGGICGTMSACGGCGGGCGGGGCGGGGGGCRSSCGGGGGCSSRCH